MRRGWRWLGLGALLIAVSGGWLGWRELTRQGPQAPAAVTAAVAASAAEPLANAWLRPAATTAALPGASAASGVANAAVEQEGPAMNICGVGRFTKQQAEGWGAIEQLKMMARMHALDQRKDTALSQLSARLATGSDSERVAARLVMDDAEGAASIAARSADGAAYRLALLGCRRWNAATPACRGLTTQAWLQMDPQDARPWARLVAEAWQRKDEAATTQALDEMLQRRPRGTFTPLLEAMFNAREAMADVEARGLLTVEMIGRDAGLPRDDIIFLRYCSAERVQDTARRARCERLARWQLEHANDLMDAMIATATADRVGLPAEQRPFTGEQLKRGEERFMEQSTRVIGMDCAGLRRTSEWMEQRVQLGELKMVLQGAADR